MVRPTPFEAERRRAVPVGLDHRRSDQCALALVAHDREMPPQSREELLGRQF